MKKVLLGLAALLVSANLFAGEFVIKGGLDLNQDTHVELLGGSGDVDSSSSVTLQAEYFTPVTDSVFIGGGINASSMLKLEDENLANLYPVYLAAKVKMPKENMTPYFGGKIGMVFPSFDDLEDDYYFTYDEKAGLFLGINAGVEFKNNFLVEVSVEQSNYKLEETDLSDDSVIEAQFKTAKIGLNVGYRFGK